MRGDEAVKEYTARFDHVELSSVCVPIDVRAALHLPCMSSEPFQGRLHERCIMLEGASWRSTEGQRLPANALLEADKPS